MALVGEWATTVAGRGAAAADVGTGAGHFAIFLAERGVKVAAIDASETMLGRVAENALRAGVADLVEPMACDARRLELPTATCDLVVAIGLLPWVEHPELALAEMIRITKPGGQIIVTMDNASSLTRWLDPGWHVSVRGLIRRIRRHVADRADEELPVQLPAPMTQSEFTRLLSNAGLVPLKFGAVGFGPFTFLGRSVLPNGIGLRIDRLLQRLADYKLPWLSRIAIFYVAAVGKPAEHGGLRPSLMAHEGSATFQVS
jgi:ubiquinone/menaquinone biosynthesis C-methylase UbiE